MTVLNIISVIFLVVGVWLTAYVVWSFVLGQRSHSWGTVPGAIISATIRESRGNRGGMFYSPRVAYQYEVGGRPWVSSRVMYGNVTVMDREWLEQFISGARNGQKVVVHVPTWAPRLAVLVPGVFPKTWLLLLFGLVCTLIGVHQLFGILK